MRVLSFATAAYILTALILAALALVGWHEDGIIGGWHFALLACLAVAQAVQPTRLGWFLLFLLCAVYAIAMLVGALSNPAADHIVFAALGAVATIMLYRCRPHGLRARGD